MHLDQRLIGRARPRKDSVRTARGHLVRMLTRCRHDKLLVVACCCRGFITRRDHSMHASGNMLAARTNQTTVDVDAQDRIDGGMGNDGPPSPHQHILDGDHPLRANPEIKADSTPFSLFISVRAHETSVRCGACVLCA